MAHQYYSQKYQGQTYYFAVDQPDAPQEGDVRLGPVSYAGSCGLEQGFGSAYAVETYQYHSGQWIGPDTQYLVLLRDTDGSFVSVLGEPASYDEDTLVYNIIHQAAQQAQD